MQTRSEVAVGWKRAIARHASTHLIEYGSAVQMGAGTTFSMLMDEIVAQQVQTKKSLDLIVMTTNLEVMAKGRDARMVHADLLQSMQIILTGGSLQSSLGALVGPYAVEGIRAEKIRPNVVFFGAAGVSFANGLSIRYQFADELATQEAYATRPTDARVLLCDHTKLGRQCGWQAEITVDAALAHTDKFLIITTYPAENQEECIRLGEQIQAFDKMLDGLATDDRLDPKDFALRLINLDGEVVKELSLVERRREMSTRLSSSKISTLPV